MSTFLAESGNVTVPALGQRFDGRNVHHAIVKVIQELRHFFGHELTVVPHAVSAQRGGVLVNPFSQERKGRLFRFVNADALRADAVHEATAMVMACVPVVHSSQQRFIHTDGEVGSGGQHVEVAVGDNGSDFNNGLACDVKPGHFQVNPNHAVMSLVHGFPSMPEGLDSSFGVKRDQAPLLSDSKVSMI